MFNKNVIERHGCVWQFMSERLKYQPGARIGMDEVYWLYCDWCGEGLPSAGRRQFDDAMSQRGVESAKDKWGKYYFGFVVKG